MNRLRSSLIALLAGVSSFAAVPDVSLGSKVLVNQPRHETLSTTLDLQKIRLLTPAEINELTGKKSKSAVKRKAVDVTASNWKQLTGARVKDPLLTSIGLTMPEIYNVDLYQDADDELHFAISNPLKNSEYNGIALLNSNAVYLASSSVMELIAKNGEDDRYYFSEVELGTVNTSFQRAFGGTKLSLVNLAGYNIDKNGKDTNGSHYGELNDNVITFPAGTVYLYVDDKPYAYYVDDYSVALPDGKLYETALAAYSLIESEYSVSVGDLCNCVGDKDQYLAVTYTLGGDVESASVALIPMYCTPDDEYYKYAGSDMYSLGTVTKSGYFYIKPSADVDSIMAAYGSDIATRMPYSYIMAAFDANGKYLPGSGSVLQLFYQPDESDHYRSIGKGKFTDGFFPQLTSDDVAPTAEVDIEESIYDDDKGLIRVVNPFSSIAGYEAYADTTHNHYLYMNVREREGYPICIEPSSTGIDLGAGNVIAVSVSYYGMFSSGDYSSYNGTYDAATNTVTFPAQSLMIAYPHLYKGDWMTSNYYGGFSLKLPDGYSPTTSSVADIAIDNDAPIEYFNLQGMRIDNPTPGQLVIRRQGAATTKLVVR
jgi:hypothetical protein